MSDFTKTMIIIGVIALCTGMGFGVSKINTFGVTQTMYTSFDIVEIDYEALEVYGETIDTSFQTLDQLREYVEDLSVKSSVISGYADDVMFNSTYMEAVIYPTIDTNCNVLNPFGELIITYNGPNWGINPEEKIEIELLYFNRYDNSIEIDCNGKNVISGSFWVEDQIVAPGNWE